MTIAANLTAAVAGTGAKPAPLRQTCLNCRHGVVKGRKVECHHPDRRPGGRADVAEVEWWGVKCQQYGVKP